MTEPIELRELRTLHAKHFKLPDGKRMAVLQQGQHFYDRDTQAYEDYRPVIEADEYVPGFSKRFKGIHWSRFAVGGVWRFGFGVGRQITYTPQDATLRLPVESGDLVDYADLWDGVDMQLRVFPEGVKESLILKAAGTRTSFGFGAALQGIELRQNGPAVDVLAVGANGAVVGRLQAPSAVDAAGAVGQVTLTLGVDGNVLTLAVDEAWLADEARAWPVVVDPTTVTIQPDGTTGQDTTITEASPDSTAWSTSSQLQFGNDDNAKDLWCLVKFELSGIPSGAVVTAATFSLYVFAGPLGGVGSTTMRVRQVAGAWQASTATWNTRPGISTSDLASKDSWSTPEWWDVPCASLVQGWLHDGGNNGFVALSTDATASLHMVCLSCRDSTAAIRPKLSVTYEDPPTVTVTNPNGMEASPTAITDEVTPDLVGAYTSGRALDMAYRQHQVFDADGNLVWDSAKTAEVLASGSTVTVAVPATELVYGEKYRWRWRAWDSAGGRSDWAEGWFICSLSAPTNLSATADATNAEIDLAWDAHAGETVAGYNVYRRVSATSTWIKDNVEGLVVGTAYTDKAVGSGISYDYKITAVSSDGYESDYSAVASTSVSFGGYWLGSHQICLLRWPIISKPRRVSKNQTIQGKWKVQDFGNGAREISLRIRFLTLADRDAIQAIFDTTGAILSYRDHRGDSIKGYLSGDLTPEYLHLGATAGYIDIVLSEAVA